MCSLKLNASLRKFHNYNDEQNYVIIFEITTIALLSVSRIYAIFYRPRVAKPFEP